MKDTRPLYFRELLLHLVADTPWSAHLGKIPANVIILGAETDVFLHGAYLTKHVFLHVL